MLFAFDFIRFLDLIKSADLLPAHFSYSMATGYLSFDFIFLHSWLSPVTAVFFLIFVFFLPDRFGSTWRKKEGKSAPLPKWLRPDPT